MLDVTKAGTVPRRRPVGRATLPIITENSDETNGTINPTNDAVVRGQEAWKCLKETGRTTWEQWKVVGQALLVGRHHAMEVAKIKTPNGKRYSEAFHFWLQSHGFDAIEKADRHKLLSIMEDLERIEKWREGLTEAQRVAWNHPSTVWRISQYCKDRGIDAVNRKAEAPIPNPQDLPPPAEKFEEENAELVWQRGLEGRARKAIGEAKLNDHWLFPEPPTKGLISVVEQAVLAWEATLDYLKGIQESTSEELADARQTFTEAKRLRARKKAEPALEGAD
jgi:hypothetical protein